MKLTDSNNSTSEIFKFYLLVFCNFDLEKVNSLEKSDLIFLVTKAEKQRRPNRNFTLVTGFCKKADNWEEFDSSFIKKGDFISVNAVETVKKFQGKNDLPYRTLIFGPDYFLKFQNNWSGNSSSFLVKLLNFDCHTFRLFIPFKYFDEFVLTDGIFTRKQHKTNQTELKSNIAVTEPIFKMTDQKPETSVKGAMPDFLAARAVKFANTWDPDSPTGNNTDDVQNLLINIKKMNIFKSDAILIMSFLSENNKLNLLSVLSENQLNDLDVFLKWLSNYNRTDTNFYKQAFQN